MGNDTQWHLGGNRLHLLGHGISLGGEQLPLLCERLADFLADICTPHLCLLIGCLQLSCKAGHLALQ